MRSSRSAALLDQGVDAADLEGTPDLVEAVAVVTHEAAGLRDVAELFGQAQQRELSPGTLGLGGHLCLLFGSWLIGISNLPRRDRVAALGASPPHPAPRVLLPAYGRLLSDKVETTSGVTEGAV